MFTSFSKAEHDVRYPEDRRMFLGLKHYAIIILIVLLLATVGAAWFQYLVFGLPSDPSLLIPPVTAADPKGFPLWLALSHWVNFFFLILIIRSGLSILADHPRLYWNNGCSPNTEWIRFTPVKVPDNKAWTAKEDARYLSPVIGLPGYRHSVGLARSWHFITVPFFLLNGVVYVMLLFITNQWKRLVPVSWQFCQIPGKYLCIIPPLICPLSLTAFIIITPCSKFLILLLFFSLPIKTLIELVKSKASVTTLVFYSFGEGLYGGTYYDTHSLDNCMKPESILAWEMNYQPLSKEHGAPLRLRVENQLGYKMVKWISRIEFLETYKDVGKGFGGKNEDDEYYDLLADT